MGGEVIKCPHCRKKFIYLQMELEALEVQDEDVCCRCGKVRELFHFKNSQQRIVCGDCKEELKEIEYKR